MRVQILLSPLMAGDLLQRSLVRSDSSISFTMMCGHGHHLWLRAPITVPGITAYTDSLLYLELSAILPRDLERAT